MNRGWRYLEINKGRVFENGGFRLVLKPVERGYADAQFDDYGGKRRSGYNWHAGTVLSLRARFSHSVNKLVGTAGFGFWNAPFGDPSIRIPAWPRVTWFFFSSRPSDLPLPVTGPGRGWFASSLNATPPRGIAILPFIPPIIILNQIPALRSIIWPKLRRIFGISFFPIKIDMTVWHSYRMEWGRDKCDYWVDDVLIGSSKTSPTGPLGFVCWLDNQYLVANPAGRLRWGTLSIDEEQWLEVRELQVGRF